jgi:hypothetical protein
MLAVALRVQRIGQWRGGRSTPSAAPVGAQPDFRGTSLRVRGPERPGQGEARRPVFAGFQHKLEWCGNWSRPSHWLESEHDALRHVEHAEKAVKQAMLQ